MLLEREGQLAALRSARGDAERGSGRLVLISGESGIGKSSLVRRFVDTPSQARVLVGVCDGALPARPLGPLTDIADALGPGVAERLRGAPDRLDLFRAVLAALGSESTIFVIEDLHWADEATIDFVRYVGRRLQNSSVMVVATYRNDGLGADHPLIAVLGDLSSSATTVRLQVPPLTPVAVKEWVRIAGSATSAFALHERTNGNPFFISEVLAAGGDRIPAGVRDAVLARATRLSPVGRAVLDAAAVAGPEATPDMLLATVELGTAGFGTAGFATARSAATGIDECLDGGFLVSDGHCLVFRHDLAREIIDGSLRSATRSSLAGRALSWLELHACTDDRRMATLAERAGDAAAVVTYAPKAAQRASELGAHTEAVHHLRAAVRFRRWLPGEAQARLLDALSYECYLTERPAEALECRQLALELHRSSGDARSVGESLRWLSRISWMLGRTADAHQLGRDAVDTLKALPAGPELAMAVSNMSQCSCWPVRRTWRCSGVGAPSRSRPSWASMTSSCTHRTTSERPWGARDSWRRAWNCSSGVWISRSRRMLRNMSREPSATLLPSA